MNFVRIRSLIGLPPSAPALSALASYAAYRRLRIAITAPADQQPPRAVATPRRASSLAAAVADRPASGTSVGRRRSAKARARSAAAAAPGALLAWRLSSLARQEPQSVIKFRSSSLPASPQVMRLWCCRSLVQPQAAQKESFIVLFSPSAPESAAPTSAHGP